MAQQRKGSAGERGEDDVGLQDEEQDEYQDMVGAAGELEGSDCAEHVRVIRYSRVMFGPGLSAP